MAVARIHLSADAADAPVAFAIGDPKALVGGGILGALAGYAGRSTVAMFLQVP